MPSPTSTTVPTLRVSTPASNASIDDLMMLVISSERMAMRWGLLQGARGELVPQPLEAAPDAPVDESIADPDDDPAEQAGVDAGLERDAAAGHLLQTGGDRPDLGIFQRDRARRGGVADVVAEVVEPAELRGDARQLLDPAAPDHEQGEVPDLSGEPGVDVVRDREPLLEREGRVRQHLTELAEVQRGRGLLEAGLP